MSTAHAATGPLSMTNVCVDAGSVRILRSVKLELRPGQLCGLIGPSGAGKSTLFKVLLGLREPSSGLVRIAGKPVSEQGPLGYVPQDDALHRMLTVEKELTYAAELRMPTSSDEERARRVTNVLGQVGLEERRDVKIARLSGGQRKRVSVALELLTSPGLLILDEPTSGLDPGLEARMMGLFKQLAEKGRIILVSTHAMQSLDLCHVLVVLVKGNVAYAGPPKRALSYFGVTHYADIFRALEKKSGDAWGASFGGQLPC